MPYVGMQFTLDGALGQVMHHWLQGCMFIAWIPCSEQGPYFSWTIPNGDGAFSSSWAGMDRMGMSGE
jgi:hypothetical protein